MITWFQSREPRERVLLMVMAAMLVLFLVWFAVTRESKPSGQAELQAAQTDRELWLRAAPKLNVGSVSGDREEFTRGALIDVARKRGVDLSRMEPQDNEGLTIWIEDVTTTAFYGVMNDIITGYRVDVNSALISTGQNGNLNAQFTLTPN